MCHRVLNQLLHEFAFEPYAFDLLARLQRKHTLTVFYVLVEFAEVCGAVGVDFLAVLVAHSVLEVADKFGAFMSEVAPISPNRTAHEFSCVLVTVVEVHDAFASHETLLEVTLVYA